MGISAQERCFVFIQPSEAFSAKLRQSWELAKDLTKPRSYSTVGVHLMAIEAANENWKWYLNFLEKGLLDPVSFVSIHLEYI